MMLAEKRCFYQCIQNQQAYSHPFGYIIGSCGPSHGTATPSLSNVLFGHGVSRLGSPVAMSVATLRLIPLQLEVNLVPIASPATGDDNHQAAYQYRDQP